MNKQAPAPNAVRPLGAVGNAQQVSWSGGEKASQVFTAAYIPADRWNGWAKPYFSQEECQRLAATQADFNDSIHFEYDPDRQVWQEFNEEEEYREDCRTRVVDGELCHQIGSGFTWLECTDQSPQSVVESERPAETVRKVRSTGYAAKRSTTPTPVGEGSGSLAIPGSLDTGGGLFL